jgi:hypothetical protein
MFVGHKFEYKWKTYQNAQAQECKADSCNQLSKKENKSPPTLQTWAKHQCGRGQAHPGTDHMKAVTRQGHQGATAPQRLPPRPIFHLLMHGGMLRRYRVVS